MRRTAKTGNTKLGTLFRPVSWCRSVTKTKAGWKSEILQKEHFFRKLKVAQRTCTAQRDELSETWLKLISTYMYLHISGKTGECLFVAEGASNVE